MIQIKESERCWPFDIELDEDGDMDLMFEGHGITLDPQQAAEFLPIPQHYVNTGKLPG